MIRHHIAGHDPHIFKRVGILDVKLWLNLYPA